MVKDTYKFNSGYVVKVSLTKKLTQISYHFKNQENVEYFVKTTDMPQSISNRNPVYAEIKNCINPVSPKKVKSEEVRKILIKLQKIVSALQGQKEVQLGYEENEKAFEKRKKLKEAGDFLKQLDNPLLYIGSLCDWLSAGERINILICFVTGCSQIVLKNPISLIGYGESSSGKTHVIKTALELLPSDFVVFEKQVSPASLFNRAKIDEYFYDNKIVYYGDMGGQNDRENMQQTIDLMKELQTDGELNKPISVKGEDGNWTVEELHLKGKPAIWQTTVPAYMDSQETSRAIIFSPRTDNREIFHKMKRLTSLKYGKTYNKRENAKKASKLIPYFVLHLRETMKDYIVVNPYYNVIEEMLEKSKYYKRDADKYFNLLETITAINFYQNEHYIFEDGQKAVITSKNDVRLFLSLLECYMASISVNIKPKAEEVYKELQANIEDWKLILGADADGLNSQGFEVGVTCNDFFERTKIKFNNVRSVQQYFKDLHEAGLIKKVGKRQNNVMYDINSLKTFSEENSLEVNPILETVQEELGYDVAEIVAKDTVDEKLDITNQHELVEMTLW